MKKLPQSYEQKVTNECLKCGGKREAHPITWVEGKVHCRVFISGEREEDTMKIIDKLTNDICRKPLRSKKLILCKQCIGKKIEPSPVLIIYDKL